MRASSDRGSGPDVPAQSALGEWQQTPVVVDARMVAAFAYIGVAATCLAFLAWNEGVRLAGPVGAMAIYNMLPVYGAMLGALFLGERLATGQVAGGVLVIADGLVAALGRPTRALVSQTEGSET